jgi:tetratricopeptide (TPR) repeat protein/predicted aspartyl protease
VRKYVLGGAAALLTVLVASPADAACSIGQIAELPVTMDRMGPMIAVKINGMPVRLMADSGAFFSVISPGSAQSLHLPLGPAPFGFYMRGINGTASVSVATVKTFTLAGIDLPRVQFLVGGSETGGAGVIGQNVFGIGDVEYDLPHGAIRLLKTEGCGKANLAYWANGKSQSTIVIEPRSPQNPHTIGTIYVNGKVVRGTFDTDASTSILSLSAAARAGITPESPGVVDGGMIWGFGHKRVRTWIAPVNLLAIGDGEQIQHARIRFGAMDVDTDMLIGADFFIAHRVYVDNKNHRLFLTYEGGPVFNIKARYDGPEANGAETPADPTSITAKPADAESLSRVGAVAMARDDPDSAIADFTKAIALAPAEPRYLDQRAQAYFRQGKRGLARADLDQAITLKPDDTEALLARALVLLRDRNRAAAMVDLDTIDRAIDAAAMERLRLGVLFTDAGQPQRAIGVFDQWIKAHPDDVRRPNAQNGRCWACALAGQDLDAALRDCDAALRAQPGTAAFLDSRGLTLLRKGEFAKAITDYDAALAGAPRTAWSLYGRGIAKLRIGEKVGGAADMVAAGTIRPDIGEEARRYGLAP